MQGKMVEKEGSRIERRERRKEWGENEERRVCVNTV